MARLWYDALYIANAANRASVSSRGLAWLVCGGARMYIANAANRASVSLRGLAWLVCGGARMYIANATNRASVSSRGLVWRQKTTPPKVSRFKYFLL